MDIDLRKLRYFVTVADSASFRKASEVLRIAQPALSRQIRALEQELGVDLFRRTPKGVEVTVAGKELLEEARVLLRSSAALVSRVRSVAREPEQITVGFRLAINVTSIVRQLRARMPGLAVNVTMTSLKDQAVDVLEGRLDACFARKPFAIAGLNVIPLYTEPRVIAVAAGHPFAEKTMIEVHDALEVPMLQPMEDIPELQGHGPDVAVHNARMDPKPTETQVVELLEEVASGGGYIVVPESIATYYGRTDIVYRRADWIIRSEICLLRRRGDPSAAVDLLTELAQKEVWVWPPVP